MILAVDQDCGNPFPETLIDLVPNLWLKKNNPNLPALGIDIGPNEPTQLPLLSAWSSEDMSSIHLLC